MYIPHPTRDQRDRLTEHLGEELLLALRGRLAPLSERDERLLHLGAVGVGLEARLKVRLRLVKLLLVHVGLPAPELHFRVLIVVSQRLGGQVDLSTR